MDVNGDSVFFSLRNTVVGREEEEVMAYICLHGTDSTC